MADYKLLLKGLKQENQLNETILELAKTLKDHKSLEELLKSINIGEKRRFYNELKIFVYYNNELPEDKDEITGLTIKEKYENELDKSEYIFDQIEEIITEKLGIEEIRKNDLKNKSNSEIQENRNTFADFDEKLDRLSLESSLKSIIVSHKIIQKEIPNMVVTDKNYSEVLQTLMNINDVTGDWLSYLLMQKKNRNFTLLDDKFLDLYDETIKLAKVTLNMESCKRREILLKYQKETKIVFPKESFEKLNKQANVKEIKEETSMPIVKRNKGKDKIYSIEDFEELSEIRNNLNAKERISKKILKGYRTLISEDSRDTVEKVLKTFSGGGISRRAVLEAAGTVAMGKILVDLTQSEHPIERHDGEIFIPRMLHRHKKTNCNHGEHDMER